MNMLVFEFATKLLKLLNGCSPLLKAAQANVLSEQWFCSKCSRPIKSAQDRSKLLNADQRDYSNCSALLKNARDCSSWCSVLKRVETMLKDDQDSLRSARP